jgi:hypothetical protein
LIDSDPVTPEGMARRFAGDPSIRWVGFDGRPGSTAQAQATMTPDDPR